jgi:hypothetical protein
MSISHLPVRLYGERATEAAIKYMLLVCGDEQAWDEAFALAGRLPSARLGTIEIWPIMEIAGLPAS